MERLIEPELLDELPAENLEAIGSRRDLRRVNRLMGHAAIAARALREAFPGSPPRSLLEIGAGDGTFLLGIARRLAPQWRPVKALLLDRQPIIEGETVKQFENLRWSVDCVAADVFEWLAESGEVFDVVLANLFLHHFEQRQLRELFRSIAARAFACIAVEPRRAGFPLVMSRLLWLVGCNRVTCHDAVASVRAGFKGTDLGPLWPVDSQWRVREQRAGWFSHRFSATRPMIG